MTLRPRTTRPTSRTTRLRRLFEGEERQQAVVTILFVLTIAAVVLILLGAIGLAFYNDNLRPLARVGALEVQPQLVRDRINLEQWRIQVDKNRLTEANISQEIDAETLAARQGALDQELQALATTGLEDLVDVIYQSQLAPTQGIAVTDADVDLKVAETFAGIEKRHVLAIAIEAQSPEGETGTVTIADRRAALAKAEEALAALEAGTDWATVAMQFGTDTASKVGGDLGLKSEIGIGDTNFGEELFKLESGATTGIIRGNDGIYRIGRVTEIVAAGEQPGLREDLAKNVSDTALRNLLRYEVAAERLREKIVAEALVQTPDQARIAIIEIAGAFSEDPAEAEGEVKYSEIAYAPNDDLEVAPDLPEEDAAWGVALTDAQAAFDELSGMTAGEIRAEAFRQKALEESDSPTGEDGGEVDYTTRGLLPDAVGNALFDTEYQQGDIIGPIRGDAAYYVLMFEDRRDSPEQRVQEVKDLLAQPNADFAEIARLHSDGTEAEDGGEVGWVTKKQLAEDLRDPVFALAVGGVTDALELGDSHYFIKVEEKQIRGLDADQLPDARATAFDDWYQPLKDQAKRDDVIVISGEEEPDPSLEAGGD